MDLLLFQAYPAHPHALLSTPTVKALSLEPVFTQVPPLETVLAKFVAFIDGCCPTFYNRHASEGGLAYSCCPVPQSALCTRYSEVHTAPVCNPSATNTMGGGNDSPRKRPANTEALFPLVDMWRLASTPLLRPGSLQHWPMQDKGTRNYVLTALRLLANTFKTPVLARGCAVEIATGRCWERSSRCCCTRTPWCTQPQRLAFNAAAAVQRAPFPNNTAGGAINLTTVLYMPPKYH
ncbi:hypothetical protein B0H14DRAFT_3777013 [Mycena olivaceomarginata]|nr:hypothetical protein B0H14DRAFT_3777013 [Mycena olivaceomarginata]